MSKIIGSLQIDPRIEAMKAAVERSFMYSVCTTALLNTIRIMGADKDDFLNRFIDRWKQNFIQQEEMVFRMNANPANILDIGNYVREIQEIVDAVEMSIRQSFGLGQKIDEGKGIEKDKI